jgi:hypothetical protein
MQEYRTEVRALGKGKRPAPQPSRTPAGTALPAWRCAERCVTSVTDAGLVPSQNRRGK